MTRKVLIRRKTNQPLRSEVFKRSSADLNSVYILLGWITKVKELSFPYSLLITDGRTDGFMAFKGIKLKRKQLHIVFKLGFCIHSIYAFKTQKSLFINAVYVFNIKIHLMGNFFTIIL